MQEIPLCADAVHSGSCSGSNVRRYYQRVIDFPLPEPYGYQYSLALFDDEILEELGAIAEGVKTSKAVCELAKKLDLEVPVSSAIYEAVYTDITPEALLEKLMNRKLKEEECYV